MTFKGQKPYGTDGTGVMRRKQDRVTYKGTMSNMTLITEAGEKLF